MWAACAVHPEQVQHAEWTSSQSSESTTDNSDGESLDPQDNAIPTTSTQFKHLKGSAWCMTSAQWIDEFKAAEDMKRREIAEKEERHRKRKAALEENAALERMNAIMKSGGRKGAQCCTPSLPNDRGGYLWSIRFIDLRMNHHCKPIILITFLMRFSVP